MPKLLVGNVLASIFRASEFGKRGLKRVRGHPFLIHSVAGELIQMGAPRRSHCPGCRCSPDTDSDTGFLVRVAGVPIIMDPNIPWDNDGDSDQLLYADREDGTTAEYGPFIAEIPKVDAKE